MYLCSAMKCFICITAFNLNKLHVDSFAPVPSHYFYTLPHCHWLCAFSNAYSDQTDGFSLIWFPFPVAYIAIGFVYLPQDITVHPLTPFVALSATPRKWKKTVLANTFEVHASSRGWRQVASKYLSPAMWPINSTSFK